MFLETSHVWKMVKIFLLSPKPGQGGLKSPVEFISYHTELKNGTDGANYKSAQKNLNPHSLTELGSRNNMPLPPCCPCGSSSLCRNQAWVPNCRVLNQHLELEASV